METSFELGQKVYNRGDMANIEHFGTITKIDISKWGESVQITPDKGSCDRAPYMIPAFTISIVDSGNGSTRIVTLEAYNERRKEQIEKCTRYIENLKTNGVQPQTH